LSEAIGEAGEMPHKFKIGTVVNYRPKDRMLSTARGTYTITGLMPAIEDKPPEYRIKHFSEDYEQVAQRATVSGTGSTGAMGGSW